MCVPGLDLLMGLPVPAPLRKIGLITSILKETWPDALIVSADGSNVTTPNDLTTTSWRVPHNFFIYKDREAYEAWKREAPPEDCAGQLIFVMILDEGFSFAVSDEDAESCPLVEDLMWSLNS